MGGCCSAQGTASGAPPAPGASPARDKAKATLRPAQAHPPAKADGKKVPPAASTSKKVVPAGPPVQATKTSEPTANKAEEKQPAVPAEAAPKDLLPAAPPLPPPSPVPAANAEKEGAPVAPPSSKAEAHFGLPPPPATQKASPIAITPERAKPPQFTPRSNGDDTDDGTRGPSTARVEEVPPSPARESVVATGKALPADDARVLQRVPPPPPPLSVLSAPSVQETPREEPEQDEGNARDAEDTEGAAAAEEPNPLADILRRQQEEKQRYPTALTTDAKDDAPLEISMEEGKKGTSAAGGSAAATGAAKYAADDSENGAAVVAAEEVRKKPLAEPGTVMAFPAPADDSANVNAASRHGRVFKILLHEEWEELRETGEFHGNAVDRVDGCIGFATADQAREAATAHPGGSAPLVLVCCTIEALSKPAGPADGITAAAASSNSEGASPLRWEAAPLLGQRQPQLHRALYRDADVLWFTECANGSAVAARLAQEMVVSDGGSEGNDDEAPEKVAFTGDKDDLDNKAISFTDTSEIERELAEEDNAENAKEAADVQDSNGSIDMPSKARAAAGEGSYAEDAPRSAKHEEDKDSDNTPQPVVKAMLPDITLASPSRESDRARAPTQHAVSMMQAPEAAPATPQDGFDGGVDGLEPPRRVPPPLPSPPAEPLTSAADNKAAVKDGEATPPPSRPAPPTILSPQPA
ncbi:hypothetical protein ABB37_03220 [Leptomonas pyrrhocoris]|uniref:Uncharacterized protein n=1 Tax=Leptomonas pyrrhocoris TaxID=157538 RepID=A0A0N0DWP2_LEPPY|nr:hypothetical protein ABB37_03220 [Leptomonas pyrrhocoris]XP_015660494.1 hypothetical protein ABB37_03220 [Leptomonas pyrrhocoris]XP_015660495.1 hypothetical protein ABB37_03220 [Leptomonas pyrrhocoris]KPA82054.1 hypothetical protein ABB37_03220 [Leptomonas pyrrhocoris]KPA82055.1 hypothetical protein ABB37_03220 [Leptomonas pyrrhocoris]KPA82056.1 hypothetical protein ABB37_03220 [Leptomonas pyrrhocoris]|eukprot:XP_015660493.1 hypothetical protein ABB37_03220 [Leptomonas pyrrhocoris]